MLANLVLIFLVLLALEVPLGVIYSRHEHDSLNTALQRDAASLAALSGEIVEHPGDHDVGALARRFSAQSGEIVTIVDRVGTRLSPPNVVQADPRFRKLLDSARAGSTRTGELDSLTYVALPLGASGEFRGAIAIARSDEMIDQRVHRFWLLLLSVGLGVLALSLFVSNQLGRWVINPLRRLDDHAAALGRGDLAVRADTTRGPPEVVSLAETFNEMAGRLDELIASQRRFAADAGHQLRTPLTVLRLRLENMDPSAPDTVVATRVAALAETARLTRLVDGLLALARAEGHRPNREMIDVSRVIRDRQDAWAPLAAELDVALAVTTSSDSPRSAALVPGHLEQILDNLIDNALDACPAGGSVALRVATLSDAIELHVSDTGPGMTEDERRRAFDPFWQNPNGESSGSSGLGLAIAQQLARSSRGSISLETSPSGGVDAVVRFPALTDAVSARPRVSS